MKKILIFLLSACVTFSAGAMLAACGGSTDNDQSGTNNNQNSDSTLKTFTGVSLSDKTVTYDGGTYSIEVAGNLPEGTTVTYTGNGQTNAGVYNVTATVSKEGYNTLELSAKLTISKADFTGLTFADCNYVYFSGREYEITVGGTLPQGTQIVYENNKKSEVGEWTAKATVTNPNYNTLVMEANLTVKKKTEVAVDAAQMILNELLQKPQPWSFMPEALAPENMAYASMPATDFTNFVQTGSIGKKAIGKQMYVMYDALTDAAKLLGYVDNVTAVGGAIAGVYQTYINNNPDDYKQFTGSAGGFSFKITLDEDKSEILAGNSLVSLEMTYDKESGVRTGRIQISDGMALKYETSENKLKLAVRATVVGAGELKQIEFIRSGENVTGYMYEYLGAGSAQLKTSAVIASNASKTVVMSNKRESDDLLIKGYEEVYNSQTGEFIGGEVQETIKTANYDTLWFMLGDVSGFNTVKVDDESNGMNADTIYVNGAATAFEVEKNSILGVPTSRKFDVEMKDVWYIQAVNDGGKITYEKVKTSIPMLFVQKADAANFGSMVKSKNPGEFATAPVLPATYKNAVETDYAALQTLFNTIKELMTYEQIDTYIGQENTFFAK